MGLNDAALMNNNREPQKLTLCRQVLAEYQFKHKSASLANLPTLSPVWYSYFFNG